MPDPLPRPIEGGLCTACKISLYFDRDTRTLWCRRCRRHFQWLSQPEWSPQPKPR